MGAVQVATSITALTTGQRGYHIVSLEGMTTTSVPTVLSGSTLEVAGALFAWTGDETPNASSWTAIATGATVYMQCTPSGSAGSQILTTSYTNTAPTWVASKGAWYTSSGSNVRVVALMAKDSATSYNQKSMLGSRATMAPVVSYVNASTQTQTSPVEGTFYNLGGSVVLPAGRWEVSYGICVETSLSAEIAGELRATLSDSTSTELSVNYTAKIRAASDPAGDVGAWLSKTFLLDVSTLTIYYLNVSAAAPGVTTLDDNLIVHGEDGATTIVAKRISW